MPSIQRTLLSSPVLVLLLLVRPFASSLAFPLDVYKLFSPAHSSLPASSQSEKNPIGNLADHEDVGKHKPELASVGAPVPADPYLDYV
jgi:hypothetical protein